MNTVIFQTENAVIKFTKKEVKERLICMHSEYVSDEVPQLLKMISIDRDETILIPEDLYYSGYVVLFTNSTTS